MTRSMKYILGLLTLCAVFSCGSKKSILQKESKTKTDIELEDNSKINSKIESEKQFLNTNTKERIVTMYGVRFDTIYQSGEPIIVPLSYPISKEENRDIENQNYLYRLSLRDSIQNAVELKYSSRIDEKEKKIIEIQESRLIYQISTLIMSIVLFILFLLRAVAKIKHLKRFLQI